MKKRILQPPSFDEELQLIKKGFELIAGVDEVGRGSLAGPIVAAAVILPTNFSTDGVHDSKLINPKKRKYLAEVIKKEAIAYAFSEISVAFINRYGIGKANQKALRVAVYRLIDHLRFSRKNPNIRNSTENIFILIDGFAISYLKGFGLQKQKPIIKGDRKSYSIAAASIIAKVYRDSLMEQISGKYYEYGFAENKGYGTSKHLSAIRRFGLCDIHRTSFNLKKYL